LHSSGGEGGLRHCVVEARFVWWRRTDSPNRTAAHVFDQDVNHRRRGYKETRSAQRGERI
jgi:hypothetical protein